jgi:hypothetical protein
MTYPPTDEELERDFPKGELIGSGTSRDVYAVAGRDDIVVKQMNRPFPMPNMVEWLVWQALLEMVEGTGDTEPNPTLHMSFAKCYTISQTGKFLVMERLTPLAKHEVFERGRDAFPFWLNDVKPSALGKDGSGRVKVLDYAMVHFFDALNPLNRSLFGRQ